MSPFEPAKDINSQDTVPISKFKNQINNDWPDLNKDPDFQKLHDYYQNADFTKCDVFVAELERRYPGHPDILRIKNDLQMKLSLKDMKERNIKEGSRQRRKVTARLGVFAVVGTLIVLAVVFVSILLQQDKIQGEGLTQETAQLNSVTKLYEQAEDLLRIGQPQPAATIVARISEVDPGFESLSDLSDRTDALLALEEKYDQARDLMEQNQFSDAKVILEQIEAERPGLWDINQLLKTIETSLEIERSLADGSAAYEAENWDVVITAYENAMLLDPGIDDPMIEEQLLRSYLNKIITMLQNETTSIEDIENAEQYYRKAIAMIPQNSEFSNERINLEEVSSELLKLKYSQLAKAMLADKNQTRSSVAKAVSYFRKAAGFDPRNSALQRDLRNAEYYQVAFQNFIDMNWLSTINNLTPVISSDSDFAEGNARILLFEAYYFIGKQYHAAGLNRDALKYLQEAEILAWNDSGNLLKLFRLQIMIGDTYGELENYRDAVSYYQYAYDYIQVFSRINNVPSAMNKYSDAISYEENQDYDRAYMAYKGLFEYIDDIYSVREVEINTGVCLALFASENQSIVDAILEANNLPMSMVITFGRTLKVPVIDN